VMQQPASEKQVKAPTRCTASHGLPQPSLYRMWHASDIQSCSRCHCSMCVPAWDTICI
jgi:hypothetical protein